MTTIHIVTAADIQFKDMVDKCVESVQDFKYNVFLYNLGDLGYGERFDARYGSGIGAKIPSKPFIVLDAIEKINDNDILVWMDADTIMWDNIDDIDIPYDVGVTVRKSKSIEGQFPINAGVIFFRKNQNTLNFLAEWATQCENSHSDQLVLNRLLKIKTTDVHQNLQVNDLDVRVFDCDTYNNFYFKQPQLHAKITHYKSKHRWRWPERTIKKKSRGN